MNTSNSNWASLVDAWTRLIAADREYDAADRAFSNAEGVEESNAAADRMDAAVTQREKALAEFDQVATVPELVEVDRAYDAARLAFFGAKSDELDAAELRLDTASDRRAQVLSQLAAAAS